MEKQKQPIKQTPLMDVIHFMAQELTYTHLDEIDSTSSYLLRQLENEQLPAGTVVYADNQTSGRGQRGNTWSSEKGENLLFSILLRPQRIDVKHSFIISQAVALAIVEQIRPLIFDELAISVKWPNDIYVEDRKIAGILIENAFAGNKIERSVIGIGLNVNQKSFPDWVPNPVSLWQLSKTEYDLEEFLRALTQVIAEKVDFYDNDFDAFTDLRATYKDSLWRGDGFYPYQDAATGEVFMAEIVEVLPSGHIILRDLKGETRQFAFKEVIQNLPENLEKLI